MPRLVLTRVTGLAGLRSGVAVPGDLDWPVRDGPLGHDSVAGHEGEGSECRGKDNKEGDGERSLLLRHFFVGKWMFRYVTFESVNR